MSLRFPSWRFARRASQSSRAVFPAIASVVMAVCSSLGVAPSCTSLNNNGRSADAANPSEGGGARADSGNGTGGLGGLGGSFRQGGAGSPGTGGAPLGAAGAGGGSSQGGIGAAGGRLGTAGAGAGGKGASGGANGGKAGGMTGGMTGGAGTGGLATGGMGLGGGTGGLHCASTELLCNGACLNTQSDAKNCGACGHDCLGGTCAAGQCQAVMLGRYDRYLGVNGVSVARDYVYAKGETNLLTRAKKDGTSLSSSFLPTFATAGCSGGAAEQLNGRVVYQWNDGSSCRMAVCSTDDCDGTTQAFSSAEATSYVSAFATDRTNFRVFWYDGTSKRFVTSPATTAGLPTVTTISSGDLAPETNWVGYSSDAIYFLARTPDLTIQRLPITGGEPQSVVSFANADAGTLWASATRLYFADPTGTYTVALPSGTGGKQTVTTTIVRRLWSDDVDLYFRTDSDPTKLQTCKVASCAATTKTVFNGLCTIDGIRGESDAVYFGSYGTCSPTGATPVDKMQLWKLAR